MQINIFSNKYKYLCVYVANNKNVKYANAYIYAKTSLMWNGIFCLHAFFVILGLFNNNNNLLKRNFKS